MKYKRVILKISGEAFSGEDGSSLDSDGVINIAKSVQEVAQQGVEIGIVLGGGNFLRGAEFVNQSFVGRVSADQMGMLATVMNALALQEAFIKIGQASTIFSALSVQGIAKPFHYRDAVEALENGKIVIFAGGTGNPFCTTDSAASLRSIEVDAQALLKATKVDGIYTADPKKDPSATMYEKVSYSEVIHKELAVMDIGAFTQCREHNIPIHVFNLFKKQSLTRVLSGEKEGTLVSKKV